MPLSEHVYCVAIAFKMTKQGEQWIWIKFCIKFEYFSAETSDDSEGSSYGQLVIGSFITTTQPLMHHISCSFWWNISHQGNSGPLWPRFGTLQLLAFPKTKITFEREEISEHRWNSGKYDKAADGNWKNYVRSQGAYLEGEWGVIILCTMFLVSSSINASNFHSIWLDTFWTNLI